MSKKADRAKAAQTPFRYSPEDLKPRDTAADDAFIDAFIERNREALIESFEETDRQFERGEVYTLEEAMAELAKRRSRRSRRRSS